MRLAVRFFSLAIGLVLGLFQTGYIVGKVNGIDLREHGSGNAGTTNAVRVLGTGKGMIVLFGDACKTVLSMIIIYFTFGEMYPDMRILLCMYGAVGAVISHDFPFYMHFKGGKGIACTAGLCISMFLFNPLIFFITFLVFAIPFAITHYVSLGSLLVYLALCIEFVVFGQTGHLGEPYPQGVLIEVYIIIFALAVLAYFQHRKNIVRLFKGVENKTYLSKKRRDAYNLAKAQAAERAKDAEAKVGEASGTEV